MRNLRLVLASVILLGLGTLHVHSAENIWHVKAFEPDGKSLDIKAFDKEGTVFDVKAIQEGGNLWVIDIKAFVGGKKVPVKILVSDEKYAPVKAIGGDGTILTLRLLHQTGISWT